ncbi:hypothetical protein ABIC76_000038 [Ralstonia sp. 1138]
MTRSIEYLALSTEQLKAIGDRYGGKPAFYVQKYPGIYCARRDNLRGFSKGQYGHTHGLILVDAFYE